MILLFSRILTNGRFEIHCKIFTLINEDIWTFYNISLLAEKKTMHFKKGFRKQIKLSPNGSYIVFKSESELVE